MDHEGTGAGLGWVGRRCISAVWDVTMEMRKNLKLNDLSCDPEALPICLTFTWCSAAVDTGETSCQNPRKQITRIGKLPCNAKVLEKQNN
jgi:hypothetical protein